MLRAASRQRSTQRNESFRELLRKSYIGEEKRLNPRFSDRSRSQFITIMNNLKLSYPQKMNAALPTNEYCGDFIPQESLDSATSPATDAEQKQIELTVMTNTEIYNDYFAMYI